MQRDGHRILAGAQVRSDVPDRPIFKMAPPDDLPFAFAQGYEQAFHETRVRVRDRGEVVLQFGVPRPFAPLGNRKVVDSPAQIAQTSCLGGENYAFLDAPRRLEVCVLRYLPAKIAVSQYRCANPRKLAAVSGVNMVEHREARP